jgi:hypothetical protein
MAMNINHTACGKPAVRRGGEWWCVQCQKWLTPDEIDSQVKQNSLSALEQFLPKLPPRKQSRD